MIAGISAAAVLIAAIIIAVIVIRKGHNNDANEEVETIDDSNNLINSVNPIYDNNTGNDPFKEDFEN